MVLIILIYKCILLGLRFAQMSTKRGIVQILKDYSIELSNKTAVPFEYSKNSMMLKAKNGIWLSFKKLNVNC